MIDVIQNIDSQLLVAINDLHTPFFDYFMMAYTGRWVWVPFYCAIAWFLLRRLGWRNGLLVLVAIGVAVAIADQTCATLIRPLVARLRPANLDNPLSDMVHVVNNYRGGLYGFPSCHAANTFVLATFILILCCNSLFTYIIFLWAIITCYTRLYLGVHYPGDILTGAVVGTVATLFCYYLLRAFVRIGRIKGNKDLWPVVSVLLVTVCGMFVYAAIYS